VNVRVRGESLSGGRGFNNHLHFFPFKKVNLWPHSQHFISFVTYERAQKARVLYNTRAEMIAMDKNSNLLGPFVSFEESKMLWIWPLIQYSQHFISFVTYERAQKARVLYNTRAERPAMDKNSNLLGPFVSFEESKMFWIWALIQYSHFISFVTYERAQKARVLQALKCLPLAKTLNYWLHL
jgi:hypothetical protein